MMNFQQRQRFHYYFPRPVAALAAFSAFAAVTVAATALTRLSLLFGLALILTYILAQILTLALILTSILTCILPASYSRWSFSSSGFLIWPVVTAFTTAATAFAPAVLAIILSAFRRVAVWRI